MIVATTMRAFALCLVSCVPALALTGNAAPAGGPRHELLIVGSHGTSCTGTAVAHDLVLTAGHCIEQDTTYKVVEFDTARQPHLLDVRQAIRHQQFNISELFNHHATADVALLKMAAPLPPGIFPATLATGFAAPAIGDTLTVTGYGVAIRGDGKTGGTLRSARLAVIGKPGNLQVRLVDPSTGGARAGLGACTGDSGAPVYAASGELMGIVSWSTGPNMTEGCGGITGVTPLSLYRRWIVETSRRLSSPF